MLGGIFRESDSLMTQRRRQIDTLKIFNANVSEVEADREYRVSFVSGGQRLALSVSLGPDFPLERPSLRIAPPLRHPWLDDTGQVTAAPGLINFTALSDLGRVVQAIVRELELRPAPLISPAASPPPPMSHAHHNIDLSPGTLYCSRTPAGGSGSGSGLHPSSCSALSSSSSAGAGGVGFPELSSLSVAELERLNSSADCLDEFVDSLPTVRRLGDTIDHWIDANQRTAEWTLSYESRLRDLRGEVGQRLATAAELKARHDELSGRYRTLADRYSPHSIREQLRLAAAQGDEESEHVAERFLKGQVDLDTFLAEYTHKRMLSYCRKTKEEKLSHQLEELQRAGF